MCWRVVVGWELMLLMEGVLFPGLAAKRGFAVCEVLVRSVKSVFVCVCVCVCVCMHAVSHLTFLTSLFLWVNLHRSMQAQPFSR